jgi:3'-5' exoribonuclease Rv2179c-like domain
MTQPTRIMLDIETLGTGHDAAIVQIGACRFDLDGTRNEFTCHVSLTSADLGIIDGSTVGWWMTQDDAARRSVFAPEGGGASLESALRAFFEWCRKAPITEVWANAPTFDCALVRDAARRTALDAGNVYVVPWSFREERCYRTLYAIAGGERAVPTVAHDALADAVAQATYAAAALRRLGVRV